jgi:hypothetical protein
MRRNTPNQSISFQAISRIDGSAMDIGTPEFFVQIDAGAQLPGEGTFTADGNGSWTYYPTRAETDGEHIRFTFTMPTAVTQTINVYTLAALGLGTGKYLAIVTVESQAAAVAGAGVTIRSGGLNVAFGYTLTSGQVVFSLNDGSYEATVQSSPAFEPLAPQPFVVNGADTSVPIQLTPQSITPPEMPGLCTVRAFVIHAGKPVPKADVTAVIVDENPTVPTALLAKTVHAGKTDDNGVCDLVLVQSALFTRGRGVYQLKATHLGKVLHDRRVRIPSQSSAYAEELPDAK